MVAALEGSNKREQSCKGSSPSVSANPKTRSSAESERDSAEVEIARSNRAGFTTIFYGVAKLERHESLKLAHVGSSPTSVAQAEVAKLAGGASLRN